jgi:hypothetical protein
MNDPSRGKNNFLLADMIVNAQEAARTFRKQASAVQKCP